MIIFLGHKHYYSEVKVRGRSIGMKVPKQPLVIGGYLGAVISVINRLFLGGNLFEQNQS